MATEPSVVTRARQPYVAIRGSVPMAEVSRIADRMPEVFGWLGQRGIAPAGPPFFKYNVVDMARELEIEVGVPTADVVAGEGEVFAAVLPAGSYATVRHHGHPATLIDATGALLAWADAQGLRFDIADTPGGQRWAARLELYNNDPAVQPDMHEWDTDLAFKLAD